MADGKEQMPASLSSPSPGFSKRTRRLVLWGSAVAEEVMVNLLSGEPLRVLVGKARDFGLPTNSSVVTSVVPGLPIAASTG